jgi:hypothetical protein
MSACNPPSIGKKEIEKHAQLTMWKSYLVKVYLSFKDLFGRAPNNSKLKNSLTPIFSVKHPAPKTPDPPNP